MQYLPNPTCPPDPSSAATDENSVVECVASAKELACIRKSPVDLGAIDAAMEPGVCLGTVASRSTPP